MKTTARKPPHEKNAAAVEMGRLSSAKRWGPQRLHNLGDLSPAERRIVNALIEAARVAKAGGGGPE